MDRTWPIPLPPRRDRVRTAMEVALTELAAEEKDAVLRAAVLRHIQVGEMIAQRGDPVDFVRIVVEGAVLLRDQDRVVSVLGHGDTVGLAEHLVGLPTDRPAQASAPTDLLDIPGDTVAGLLHASSRFAHSLMHHVATRLLETERDQAVLTSADALTAIAWRVHQLVARWGVDEGGAATVTVPLTQEELGGWAGVSRESTVKALRTLRARGILQTGRREIRVLDLGALNELVRWARDEQLASRPT